MRNVVGILFSLWISGHVLNAAAFGATLTVSFGSGNVVSSGMNRFADSASGAGNSIANLVDQSNAKTGIAIQVTKSFGGVNQVGPASTSSALGIPDKAAVNSFYGNPVMFGNVIAAQASLQLSGLDSSRSYDFTFFASRMQSGGDNRESQYSVQGANSGVAYLNASDNISKVAVVSGIRPDSSGKININLQKGPNNNNSYGFYYLNFLKIVSNGAASTPTPAPTPSPSATPASVVSVSVNFGSGSSGPSGVNRFGDFFNAGSAVANLVDQNNAKTNFSIQITQSFGGVNQVGPASTASALGIPDKAVANSFYGNAVLFGNVVAAQASLQLSGLDVTRSYDFTFFASRMQSGGDNREGQYSVQGANSGVAYLNASDNTSKVAIVSGIRPDSNGKININLQKGPNNNNSYGFYYLNFLKVMSSGVVVVPSPTPTQSATPTPTATPALRAPSAYAGSAQSVILPTSSAVLGGSGSDPQGLALTYSWSIVSGGTATFSSTSVASPTVSGLVAGQYVFRLTVKNSANLQATSDVSVTVKPAAGPARYGVQTAVPVDTTRFGYRPPYGYYEYLPAGYNDDVNKKWPVIIFLHGQGEAGNMSSELPKVLNTGLPQIIANGKFQAFDKFIVISPQTWAYFNPSYLKTFIDHVKKQYRIDTSRMYLTGLSYGAFALWDYVNNYGDQTEFAAIAPISGNGNGYNPCQYKTIPMWAFHGGKDTNSSTNVNNEIEPIAKINACSPIERAKITVYSNTGHGADTWNSTYDSSGMSMPLDSHYDPFNEDLYSWFLRHSK